MRVLLKVFFITLISVQCLSQGIEFSSLSWNEFKKEAKNRNKDIFLYAYSPYCRYSQEMEDSSFTNEAVADFYNTNFLSYRVNLEDSTEGYAVAEEYGITGFPTYLYFNSNGELTHQSGGYQIPNRFISEGQNALDSDSGFYAMKSRYEAGDRSPALLYRYSNDLMSSNLSYTDTLADIITEEYITTQTSTQLRSKKNIDYVFNSNLNFGTTTTQYFLSNLEIFITVYGQKEVLQRVKSIIRNAVMLAGGSRDSSMLIALTRLINTLKIDGKEHLRAVADINFYIGSRDWLSLAESTIEYAHSVDHPDLTVLYNTGVYLTYFAEDQETLSIATKIAEKAKAISPSYENLLLYAKIQYKRGRLSEALASATQAISVARELGIDASEAQGLVDELQE